VSAPDPTPSARTRRGVLATGGLAHFVCDGFTDSAYVLLPLWAAAFALTHAEVGALKMTLSGTLALAQVPAGYLAERHGERRILVAGIVAAGLGFALLGTASSYLGIMGILVVVGIGCGTQHPLASSIISRAYVSGRRAALGTYNFTGDLGKVVVATAVAASAAAYGWRVSTVTYGAVAVLAGLVVLALLLRLRSGGAPELLSADGTRSDQPQGWGIVDKRGYGTLAAIGMIDSATRLGLLTFLPFLLLDKGAAVHTVGFALSLVFAGGAAGKLLCGLIADRLGILKTVIITEIATTAFIAVAILSPLSVALAVLPLLGVALNGTSSVLYGTVGDFVDGDRQARAYGLFYTLGIGSGALSPVLFGAVSDAGGVELALGVLAACVLLVLPLCALLHGPLSRVARLSPTASTSSATETTS
jgi:MFS transporter, FSR family, fosmidomycin resistance protein